MDQAANYTDRYASYLDALQAEIHAGQKMGRRPLIGYCSNADVVLKWDAAAYNRILKKYLKSQPDPSRNEKIGTMEDFARISSWYVMRGLGGNMDISSAEVCSALLDSFSTEQALGGTGAQAAAALGTMGIPSDLHLTDRSELVCSMLSGKGICVIDNAKRIPIESCCSESAPIYHFILQFHKDDVIEIHGEEYRIPCSNRLIFFFDSVHSQLPIDEDYCHYYERSSQNLSSYLLSGFDAVTDSVIIEKRLDMLKDHIIKVREQNPNMVIYLEGAFYLNPSVKTQVMRQLGPMADIIGMNEEELMEAVTELGGKIDLNDALQVLNGVKLYMNQFCLSGIVLHTKDYAMYYGKPITGVDMEQGLTLGNLMAATRARIGRYGTVEDCRETLQLPLSPTGKSFAGVLMQLGDQKEGQVLYAVPSRYMEKPRYTIGLGDTFTAGVQIGFWSGNASPLKEI